MSYNKKYTPSTPYFIGKGKSVSDELTIRGIKLIDISYISSIYLTLGAVLSIYIDKKLGKFNAQEADKKSKSRLYTEVLLHFSLIGILTYLVRNFVEWIPFPLNGIRGYDHLKLRELTSAGTFGFIFIFFQKNLTTKITYLSNRN